MIEQDRAIKVLVVSHARDAWGAEKSLMRSAPLLADRQIELSLASPANGELASQWTALGLPHVPIDLPDHHGIRPSGGSDGRPPVGEMVGEACRVLESARRIAQLARPVDIIVSNSLWAHVECALAGRLARRPVVLEIYDRVAPGLGRRLLRLAVRWAAHSVACSEAVAECAGPTVRGRISVVHLTVDTDRFTPGPADPEVRAQLGAEADEPLVGILGRWDPEKGIDLLVEAMTRLGDDLGDTRLAVVGAVHGASQEFGRQLRERAAAALGPRVRFVPPRRDVPAVLRSLDVLVNASKAEPFGLTVLEAQACGIPVIGTRSGGIPEFVTDGETGLLVSPGDPEAMARALRRVISDPMLRARLATNARRRVDRFNRDARRADVLAGLYRKVLRS